jgi:hypothetical protein
LIKNDKNCKLLIGVLLGESKFTPVSVANDLQKNYNMLPLMLI